ncbi:hypothetical protein NL676_016114 [Syzygium grande]|nr:hypothetical protein NL676_016114 [Syzygium grande]
MAGASPPHLVQRRPHLRRRDHFGPHLRAIWVLIGSASSPSSGSPSTRGPSLPASHLVGPPLPPTASYKTLRSSNIVANLRA